MLKKLRLKFIIVNMSIVLGMLIIIFGMMFHFTKVDLEKETHTLLHNLTQDAMRSSKAKPANTNLQYFTIKMNVFNDVSAYGFTRFDLQDSAFLRDLIHNVNEQHHDEGYLEKYNLYYYRTFTWDSMVISFVDQSSQKDVLDSLVVTALIIGGISLVLFFVISLLLARWMVKPVDTAWKRQKQFISDASHELKTPLTVIMANAELLQNAEEKSDKEQFGLNILTMSQLMRGLVEGMLNLSRVDNGQVKGNFTKLNFSKLVTDTMLPFEPMFFEKGLELQSDVDAGVMLNGSDRYLAQVVEILLDNAIKYSEPGIVDLQLHRHGRSQVILTVSNPGNPIPQEEHERIFDRFYRTDEARTGAGSFGLGLAIAKSMVQEHGGRIWVESNDSGNCFCVLLPCDS